MFYLIKFEMSEKTYYGEVIYDNFFLGVCCSCYAKKSTGRCVKYAPDGYAALCNECVHRGTCWTFETTTLKECIEKRTKIINELDEVVDVDSDVLSIIHKYL